MESPVLYFSGSAFRIDPRDGRLWECPEAQSGPPAWDEEGEPCYATLRFPASVLYLLQEALHLAEGACARLELAKD